MAVGRVADAARLLEVQVPELLSERLHPELAAAVQQLPSDERSLLLRLAVADGSLQGHHLDLTTLEMLEQEAAGDPDLQLLARSCVAQHLRWRGDPVCRPTAEAALADVETEPSSRIGLLARSRLHLCIAYGFLFETFGESVEAGRAIELAIADLNEASLIAAGIATGALFTGAIAKETWRDLTGAVDALAIAAGQLDAIASPLAPLVRISEAELHLQRGAMWCLWPALRAAESSPHPHQGFVEARCGFVRCVVDVLGRQADGAFDERCERVVALLDRDAPEVAGSATRVLADVLLDVGELDRACRWGGRARQAPLEMPSHVCHRDALAARIELRVGDVGRGVALASTAMDSTIALGLTGPAALQAARVAMALSERGAAVESERWRARAVDIGLPRDSIWTAALTSRRSGGGRSGDSSISIRLLGPDVHVMVDELDVVLTDQQARIVAFLAAARRPVSVEAVRDGLWPDVEPSVGRRRLNTALWRLRRGATPSSAPLVERTGSQLRLADGVTTDVEAYLAADERDAGSMLEALRLYTDDFCARQLAYDDFAIETRRWLRNRFVTLARKALLQLRREDRASDDEMLELALRVAPFVADDADLGRMVVAVLDERGRYAEVRALRDRMELRDEEP